MKFSESSVDFIVQLLKSDNVPAILGEPGIGKSSLAEAIAEQMGTKAFTLACNQLADKADLTGGRLVPTDDGKSYKQVFFPHEVLSEAIAYALDNPRETPVVLLDEVNRTSSDVTSAALSLPTLRRIGSIRLPKNLKLMIAGNDKGHITPLDDASISRFVLIRLEPDAQTLLNVPGLHLNEHIVKVLTAHPSCIFEKAQAGILLADGSQDDDDDDKGSYAQLEDLDGLGEEMNQFTTPRTIAGLSRWLDALSADQIKTYLGTSVTDHNGNNTTMLHEFIDGFTGATTFSSYLAAEVATSITSGQNNSGSSALTAPEPDVFKDLKGATTVDELNELIDKMADREKSASIVYALFEKSDNSRIIEHLAPQTQKLEADQQRMLMTLGGNEDLDDENVKAFIGTGAPLATMLGPILDIGD